MDMQGRPWQKTFLYSKKGLGSHGDGCHGQAIWDLSRSGVSMCYLCFIVSEVLFDNFVTFEVLYERELLEQSI